MPAQLARREAPQRSARAERGRDSLPRHLELTRTSAKGSFSFIEGSAEIASRNLASEWDAFSALRPLGKARPGIRRQNGMCFPFAVFGGNCVPDPALRTGCIFRPPTSGAYVHLGAPSRARPPRHSSRFCATLQTVRSSVRTRGYTQNDTFPVQYDAGSACTIRRGQ